MPTPCTPLTLRPSRRCFALGHRLRSTTLLFFPCFARRHVPSYHRWFRSSAHLCREALLLLPSPVCHLRVFFQFRIGVHALPVDVGRRRGAPAFSVSVICLVQGPTGDEYDFIIMCPALAPVRDRFRPLFASGTRSLSLFLWQQDLCEVFRFVTECFVLRSNLLVPVG
jgi:hypothetical protein